MQQSYSWEAIRFSASQEIPRILRNPKVHYRIHNIPSHLLTLNHINSVHTPTSHFLKIHFNIILPSTPWSSKWSLSLRSPHSDPLCTSLQYVLHAPLVSFFLILSPEWHLVMGYRSLRSTSCSCLPPPITSFFWSPNVFRSTYFRTSSVSVLAATWETTSCTLI